MKYNNFIILICFILTGNSFVLSEDNHQTRLSWCQNKTLSHQNKPSCHQNKPSHNHHSKKKTCKEITLISSKDIKKASSEKNGYVISKPGSYLLCEDINWKSKSHNDFAITIDTDNVSLDFDGHFIKQTNTDKSGRFAVQITENAHYILVNNGIVQECSGGAVLVQAGASGITIDNIECNKCAYRGIVPVEVPVGFPLPITGFSAPIFFNGKPTLGIDDITVKNCTVTDNGILGEQPVSFVGTISGNTTLTLASPPLTPITPGLIVSGAGITPGTKIVSGAGVNYTITSSTNVGPQEMMASDPNGSYIQPSNQGLIGGASIFTWFASNVTINDCILDGNFHYSFAFTLSCGFSSSVIISDCIINNTVTFGLSKAIWTVLCNDLLIEDVVMNEITMNVTPIVTNVIGAGAEGVKLTGGNNAILRRCSVNGVTVQTQVPTTQTPTSYLDCAGFIDDFAASDVLLEDCSARNLNHDGGGDSSNNSYTAGFNRITKFAPVSNLQCLRCNASDLFANGGWAWGFGSNPVPSTTNVNSIYTECTTDNIRISSNAVYAAGFIINGAFNQVIGCLANRIKGHTAYGIILDITNPVVGGATQCLISNNRITNCDTLGIFDNSIAQNSAFNSNYAYLNGPGGNVNYSIDASVNPIRVWKLTGLPDLTDNNGIIDPSLDNLDIRNS